MSLRWRLTALTALIVAVTTSVLGAVVAAAATRIQMEAVDRAILIRLPVAAARALQSDPAALSRLGPASLAIARVDDGRVSVVRAGVDDDGTELPFPALTADDLRAPAGRPFTVEGDPDQRVVLRTLGAGGPTIVLAVPLSQTQDDLDRFRRGIALAVLGTTLVGAAGAFLLIRRAFRPMDRMVAAAQDVAAGQLGTRVPAGPPGTEIGELSTALNGMIDSVTSSLQQVAASEQRLRTFVSDASHEIRTPLTVIRGYTELVRAQVRDGEPVSPRALDRIDSEGARLDRLVTALLTLERSGRPRGDLAELDLTALVGEYFTDRPVLGPDRPVELTTVPVQLLGDEDGWRQVLANLAQNVARHTPADSPVAVRLERSEDEAVLVIDDAGPGIPADRRQAALDRFGRVSGPHSGEGFGLGLAVVAAVVAAHGGTVALGDSPLGGLRVTVRASLTSTVAG